MSVACPPEMMVNQRPSIMLRSSSPRSASVKATQAAADQRAVEVVDRGLHAQLSDAARAVLAIVEQRNVDGAVCAGVDDHTGPDVSPSSPQTRPRPRA